MIERRFNSLLVALTGVTPLPNCEYRFLSLDANIADGSPLTSPVQSVSNMKFEGFENLVKDGFRVHTVLQRPGYTDQLLVLIERELRD